MFNRTVSELGGDGLKNILKSTFNHSINSANPVILYFNNDIKETLSDIRLLPLLENIFSAKKVSVHSFYNWFVKESNAENQKK